MLQHMWGDFEAKWSGTNVWIKLKNLKKKMPCHEANSGSDMKKGSYFKLGWANIHAHIPLFG